MTFVIFGSCIFAVAAAAYLGSLVGGAIVARSRQRKRVRRDMDNYFSG